MSGMLMHLNAPQERVPTYLVGVSLGWEGIAQQYVRLTETSLV
jgi:hypothetical protein